MKREVIDCIGDFDAETFGRGHGEENDFCHRAEQMGYIHVKCDDTYIYHSGTKSFIPMSCDWNVYKNYLQKLKPDVIHAHTLVGICAEFLQAAHMNCVFRWFILPMIILEYVPRWIWYIRMRFVNAWASIVENVANMFSLKKDLFWNN